MPAVFYSRCRPQDADPIDIAVREHRVFIGYPAWREGIQPRRGHLREAIIDFDCSQTEWIEATRGFPDRKMFTQTRNFARKIQTGDIAMIPRPVRGVVYTGRVINPFQILNDANWANEYLELRKSQGLDASDEFSHVGDVVQCCEVDNFVAVPFATVPAWVRRSLLGRSTFGFVGHLPVLNLDPYTALVDLLDNPKRAVRPWTTSLAEVERRLAESVGPNSFEHLCVALLQLEHPKEIWEHVGGSGDGGLDGVGADADNPACVVGFLQCKWAYGGGELSIADVAAPSNARQVLACLLHPEKLNTLPGVELWSRQTIASLVLKHAQALPLAMSLRIGRPVS